MRIKTSLFPSKGSLKFTVLAESRRRVYRKECSAHTLFIFWSSFLSCGKFLHTMVSKAFFCSLYVSSQLQPIGTWDPWDPWDPWDQYHCLLSSRLSQRWCCTSEHRRNSNSSSCHLTFCSIKTILLKILLILPW